MADFNQVREKAKIEHVSKILGSAVRCLNQNHGFVCTYICRWTCQVNDACQKKKLLLLRRFSGMNKQCVHCQWLERVLSSDFLPGGTEGIVS